MKKLIRNKAGVSAFISVILMIAITVAIATTVYVYVSNMSADTNGEEIEDVTEDDEVELLEYELVNQEVVNDSLQIAVRLDGVYENTAYKIRFDYYKVVQDDPFTEEKEQIWLTTENHFVKNLYSGWSVYVVQTNFTLDFDEHETDEFLCVIEYHRGVTWYFYLGEDTINIYK